jgi:hypothetical protein
VDKHRSPLHNGFWLEWSADAAKDPGGIAKLAMRIKWHLPALIVSHEPQISMKLKFGMDLRLAEKCGNVSQGFILIVASAASPKRAIRHGKKAFPPSSENS